MNSGSWDITNAFRITQGIALIGHDMNDGSACGYQGTTGPDYSMRFQGDARYEGAYMQNPQISVVMTFNNPIEGMTVSSGGWGAFTLINSSISGNKLYLDFTANHINHGDSLGFGSLQLKLGSASDVCFSVVGDPVITIH